MKNLLDLTDKIAIVTGASSGMGREITRLFAEQGATVVALARRKERLEALAKENSKIIPFAADVTNAADLENVVKFTTENYSRIDILVNNAGTMDDMTPIADLTDELWEKVLAVNTTSVMKLTRAAIKVMLEQKSGAIVNIASVGGLFGSRAGAAYTASKHAVVGLTKNTAFMYATSGIRCNAICPGGVNTEIAQNGMTNINQFGMGRVATGIQSSPRSGEPEEIAKLALFLASDAASLVSGATITADAGWTAY